MLGKLMKYEFKATGRIFLPLYGALLIVSILNRLFTSMDFKTPQAIGFAVSVIMVIAIGVVTFILMIQRFNRNLLGNEGYLMFTLPVKTDSLIVSKLLVSAIWYVLSLLAVAVSILIMALYDFKFSMVWAHVARFLDSIGIDNLNIALFTAEGVLICLLNLFVSILYIYTCLSLSLLANKHRLLVAFGAFVAISTIGQILMAILVGIANELHITDLLADFIDGLSNLTLIHSAMGMMLIGQIIVGAIFYCTTRYMLKYRLNLE